MGPNIFSQEDIKRCREQYQKHQEEYNVFSTSLINIINSKWFQKTLPNSWKTDNPIHKCQKFCGKCMEKL